jgi:glycosyltransferase involved in cell wall biosynthesis
MRIVLDMQGAQTKSRFRGIGRYTMSLAKAIVRNRGEHEIILALSGLFPDTIEPIRAAFDGLLPQENIRVWHAPGPVRECQPGNDWRREVAERIREAFLASHRPDIIHVFSFFEGFVDDAVTSISIFDTVTHVSVTLHDLIPLVHAERYLEINPRYKQYYMRKLGYLKRASLLLAVSDSSRREALEHLGFSENQVVTTYEAVDEHFRPLAITKEEEEKLRKKFGILKPFVLYAPGGFDVRKNVEGLIRAYAQLSTALRQRYQLVITGKISEGEKRKHLGIAKQHGLGTEDMVFTGYVSDEDLVRLYNLCEVFVFPSIHEGFGLPVLEAMACGAAVIGSNTTSIPEVIGRPDALFDPHSDQEIAKKLEQVLTDEDFRNELKRHGIRQAEKFSWDKSAKLAIVSFETLNAQKKSSSITINSFKRPKLAYISPLPPEKSGISDYSAELLPELARHYDIEVVVNQKDVTDTWIKNNLPVRSVEWFCRNASSYDRVLYHFGNSPFHSHMFGLLQQYPGVVVMHDFFLSSVLAYEEIVKAIPSIWMNALYGSHGYKAVKMRLLDAEYAKMHYPANLDVLQGALGIIVHSEFSKQLAEKWYGENVDWVVIPLLRVPAIDVNRVEARRKLNLNDDAFLVCSFGIIGPLKLNHRLLDAWLASSLSRDERCILVFVGQNHGGEYGAKLLETIQRSGCEKRIRITGWVDHATFRQYLAAADMAVQLRTLSRGETSAAVLDCMNYGLPTIVNAHGSAAELPKDAVWMLPDEFTDDELIEALETLWKDENLRAQLGRRAQEVIHTRHDPAKCAEQYAQAIETFYQKAQIGRHALVNSIAALDTLPYNDSELKQIATSIAVSLPPKIAQRQLLVDVSNVARHDLRTGIERVVRAQLLQLIENPPDGFRVEPVYLTEEAGMWHYRYARKYTCNLLGIKQFNLEDDVVDVAQGDILYVADFYRDGVIKASKAGLYLRLKAVGVSINFLVYDILPILTPEFFPEGDNVFHAEWLREITISADRLICISKATADNLAFWIKAHGLHRTKDVTIYFVHQGADIATSGFSTGFPEDAQKILKKLKAKPSFLMVGTIEPRKGYLQTIAAFEQLWSEGYEVNLVIVGKEGWKHLPDHQRRTIPKIVATLQHHKELGNRLFWLEGISDEYLEQIYDACTCLIMASEAEGFGLPLIEAAQHKLPIIARDIPVFREVAGEHAFYFSGLEPEVLANAVQEWLELYKEGKHPKSDNMPWLTWKESTKNLVDILLGRREPYIIVKTDPKIMPGAELDFMSGKLNFIGWSVPEPKFRWSLGNRSLIEFETGDLSYEGIIRLLLNTLGKQRVRVFLNDTLLTEQELERIDIWMEMRFSPSLLRSSHTNQLVFELPDARRPDNGDPRVLAIALKKFVLL